jgi:hypothetical protein
LAFSGMGRLQRKLLEMPSRSRHSHQARFGLRPANQ